MTFRENMSIIELCYVLALYRLGLSELQIQSVINDGSSFTQYINVSGSASYHICAILLPNRSNTFNILSIGINGNGPEHAEEEAINKLQCLTRNKRLKRVCLLVIRVNQYCVLTSSKPCIGCLQSIACKPLQKGYYINNIYYSEKNGLIVNKTLSSLIESDTFHVTKYNKKTKKNTVNRYEAFRERYLKKTRI